MLTSFLDQVRPGEQTVHGRVRAIRERGKITFIDLIDHTSTLQLVLERGKTADYDALRQTPIGSFVAAHGLAQESKLGALELAVSNASVVARADLHIQPTPWQIDGRDERQTARVFENTSMYVANPQRLAILKVKTDFISALHKYFQQERFTLVEPPILTNKTLYGHDNAIRANVHHEDVFLSQCATFELEPLALAFGKVYTISPAFRNEQSGSRRHLAEYTHAKAEALLANIDDLMQLAGDAMYRAVQDTLSRSGKELAFLGTDIDVNLLDPKKHEQITYDDALTVAHAQGSTTPYGHGLTRQDEIFISAHCGQRYVWVMFPPFSSEGFPYRRKPSAHHLSMTCDLIAPHGAGEMVGVAEKATDPEELIQNLIEKGKREEIAQYWEYIAMRRYGMPAHGGLGAAPERIMYGLLGLNHIRLTKPWPRYPERNIMISKTLPTFGDRELEGLKSKYNLK